MTAPQLSPNRSSLSHHPAQDADKLSSAKALLLIGGGPLAWFLQFCIGVMLTSWPCFPSSERLWEPLPGYGGARLIAALVLLLFALAALAIGILAQRTLREVRHEEAGGHEELADIGHGRTRFVALWGVILGYGSAVAAALTLVAFLVVPRCAG